MPDGAGWMETGKKMDTLNGKIRGQNYLASPANFHQCCIVADPQAHARKSACRPSLKPSYKFPFSLEQLATVDGAG